MAHVHRTVQSRRDYLEIWSYIAADNVAAADRLLDKFDQALDRIADSPGIGRKRDELAASLRSYAVGNYLLFYRSVSDGIELIRVVHGARDLRRMFRG